ncbi:lipopolysaccharide biosynthesis protein [Luteirhabdus pelagi]|jgi:O-antigen/teichoic acid export membrane protein|uniref:lipopolysaccharide biosynthesis protein n=1 Tax=Luteirhabdus pelagi TaxID=2792783 RepID=UPI00193A425B|nr:polysaccharide biosynthesis C-terminal domain-containing protein [Luteirhabdus pelagi]
MQPRQQALSLNKASSLFFRMSAMGAKFLIFTYLSKYFIESTYGIYSLITTTITVSIFVLGFDFYNFSIRDILLKKENTSAKVFTAFGFYLGVYLIFVLLGYFTFKNTDYFSQYTGYLLTICITEHFNQELYRLSLAFKKVLAANTLLFIRVAGWTSMVLILILFFKKQVSLGDILGIWAYFNVGTILLTALIFGKAILNEFSNLAFKKDWLWKGLKVSMIFYVATIALKVIEYSNRYIVEGLLGEASAGIFSFYSNISMVIGIYVSTIVVSYELPDLIESSTTTQFEGKLKRFKRLLVLHSGIAFAVVLIAIYPVLLWQNKPSFMEYWHLIVLLNIATFLMNISLLYHSYLYIKHREKKLLEIVLIGSGINLIATYSLCYFFGITGAGIAFLVTGIAIFALRKRAVKQPI